MDPAFDAEFFLVDRDGIPIMFVQCFYCKGIVHRPVLIEHTELVHP